MLQKEKSDLSSGMFVFVKHGEDEEFMVNVNCKVVNLLLYIKKISKTEENDLELCDLSGEVKHLQENRELYANNVLREKEKYVLLKFERKGQEPKPTYSPLLNNDQIITEDFLMKLNSIKKNKNYAKNLAKNKINVSKPPKRNQQMTGQSINENDPSTNSPPNSSLPRPKTPPKNSRELEEPITPK